MAVSEATGGIRAAFQEAISQERRGVIGALKCMYFSTRNEISHTTNFSGLIDLAIDLGSKYSTDLMQLNTRSRSTLVPRVAVEC